MNDADPQVRTASVEALGRRREPEATCALIKSLPNTERSSSRTSEPVRMKVDTEIILRGLNTAIQAPDKSTHRRTTHRSSPYIGDRVLRTLIDLLSDERQMVREAALDATIAMRDPRAVDGLALALSDSVGRVRVKAAIALSYSTRIENSVLDGLTIKSPLNWRSLPTVHLSNDPRVLSVLVEALAETDPELRIQATKSLLRKAAAGSDELVRSAVWRAFQNADRELVLNVLGAAVRDPVQNVRVGAILMLGQLGDPQACTPLVAALSDEEGLRPAVLHALAKMEHAGVVRSLVNLLQSDVIPIRVLAVGLLWELYKSGSIDQLLPALDDPNETVCMAAAMVLDRSRDPRLKSLQDQIKLLKQKHLSLRQEHRRSENLVRAKHDADQRAVEKHIRTFEREQEKAQKLQKERELAQQEAQAKFEMLQKLHRSSFPYSSGGSDRAVTN